MQKYRLKQWYPSLAISWRTDDSYEYDADRQVMTNISNVKNGLAMPREMVIKKQELHPDFWELIEEEEPLFVTEDGVDIFDLCQTVYLIHPKTFMKQKSDLGYFSTNDLDNNKLFYNESNADEYIWKNKRVFSYNDLRSWDINGGTQEEALKVAKERSKE